MLGPTTEIREYFWQKIRAAHTVRSRSATVTAGGVVFIGYTLDDTFRAFDLMSGEILWEADLPAAVTAIPVTYEVNGAQYVVIPVGGHSMYGSTKGDSVVAYKLKHYPRQS